MITGELKRKVDRVWDAFWSGGISNPLEVIEQITYLLFIKRLDELQQLAENKSGTLRSPIEGAVFPPGDDPQGRAYSELRWSNFKTADPAKMLKIVSESVFPFLRTLGGDGSTYASHMEHARFTIPNAALLSRVVDLLDDIPMEDRDDQYIMHAVSPSSVRRTSRLR